MKEIKTWQAFDGKQFNSEQECMEYEENHLFYDLSHISFYSNRGKLIINPCEHNFLDCNRFKVNNKKALELYIKYCNHYSLIEPYVPSIFLSYPLHFRFINSKWECLEEKLAEINYDIINEFNDAEIEKEISHDFMDCANFRKNENWEKNEEH